MKQLIAKVKGRKKPCYYKLISDKDIYDIDLNTIQMVKYEPDHKLDEDSWFKIEDFNQQDFCIDILKKQFISSEYNQIPSEKFSEISFLCSFQDNDYFFQKVTPSLFATKKTLSFGENVTLEEDSRRIFINPQPDAIYISSKNILAFRNLATISSIFKGIDELYKEATNEEVNQFLNESFIELSNGYDVEKVSKPNRKRIALAINTLSSMSDNDRKQILSYIKNYCENRLSFDEQAGKFEIKTDEELKYLIYGIEQRFYTTPVGQEKRLANSVQSLA